MKQVYTKPVLMMETFTLSQTIATDCTADNLSTPGGNSIGRPLQWSKTTCGWLVGDQILWVEGGGAGCNVPFMTEDTAVDGLCYNNPNGGNAIFRS